MKIFCIFAGDMVVIFEKEYLKELYIDGKTSDKRHRFQPDIVSRYNKVINMMVNAIDINDLMRIGSLHYEHLGGDKKGVSSVRVTVCNIVELTNHYK